MKVVQVCGECWDGCHLVHIIDQWDSCWSWPLGPTKNSILFHTRQPQRASPCTTHQCNHSSPCWCSAVVQCQQDDCAASKAHFEWCSARAASHVQASDSTLDKKQLTCVAGNIWSHTLGGNRAGRTEYLLLHEFHQLKFLPPEKKRSVTRLQGSQVQCRSLSRTQAGIVRTTRSSTRSSCCLISTVCIHHWFKSTISAVRPWSGPSFSTVWWTKVTRMWRMFLQAWFLRPWQVHCAWFSTKSD